MARMERPNPQLARPVLAAFFVLVLFASPSWQLSQLYCSSQNTGESEQTLSTIYMSNGKCHDFCISRYAFAVVQDENCWCSNYVPSDQVDVSSCSDQCPGYPPEYCGSGNDTLYGYIKLDRDPSGTAAAASSTQAAAQTSDRSSSPTPSSQSQSSPSSSPSSTQMTSFRTLTVSGQPITQTVTSMPTSSPQVTKPSSKSLSTGALVGAIVGAVAAVLVLSAVVLWFCWRHHRRSYPGSEAGGVPAPGVSPRRNLSNMSRTSRAGLLTFDRGDRSKGYAAQTGVYDGDDAPQSDERRYSRPILVDSRLNPDAILTHDNSSRNSGFSIEDNRDYTRTLNVRNPDPPEDD